MLEFGGVFDSNYRWTGNTSTVAVRTCRDSNVCGNIKLEVMNLVCFTCILLVLTNWTLQDVFFGSIFNDI